MSEGADQSSSNRVLRTCQIIVGAMLMGLLVFVTLVLFVIPKGAFGERREQDPPFLTYTAIVFSAVGALASVLVPKWFVASARRRIALESPPLSPPPVSASLSSSQGADPLIAVFPTQFVLGIALLEGGVFMSLIAYMTEHRPLSLGLVAVLIFGVASRFPTAAYFEQWLEAQKELILLERQFGE